VHPDRQQASQDEGQHAAEQFARLHRAYEVLSDPESRAKYDRYLAAGLNLSYDTWLGTPTPPTPLAAVCSLTLRACRAACAVCVRVRVRSCCVQTCSSISGSCTGPSPRRSPPWTRSPSGRHHSDWSGTHASADVTHDTTHTHGTQHDTHDTTHDTHERERNDHA
jgi:hypothetical protein